MIALLIAFAPAVLAPQQTEQMRVRPSTEAQAVAEFEATCVKGLYDGETLKRNAASSSRGYTYFEGSDGWRNWNSPYGTIHYLATGNQNAAPVPRCNLTSFTRAKVDRRALDVALRAMAKRQSIGGYSEFRENSGLAWSWYARAGQPMTVGVVLDKKTPQQIILTLKPFVVQS